MCEMGILNLRSEDFLGNRTICASNYSNEWETFPLSLSPYLHPLLIWNVKAYSVLRSKGPGRGLVHSFLQSGKKNTDNRTQKHWNKALHSTPSYLGTNGTDTGLLKELTVFGSYGPNILQKHVVLILWPFDILNMNI